MIQGADADWVESFRRLLWPKLGKIAQLIRHSTGFPLYTKSRVTEQGFVGRVSEDTEQFEKSLEQMDFERNPLSTLKRRNEDDIEEGSWRRIGFDDESMQLHVVIYDSADVENATAGDTFVYAHFEKRWDTDPLAHLRKVGLDKKKGRDMMREILNRNGYSWDSIRPSAFSTN